MRGEMRRLVRVWRKLTLRRQHGAKRGRVSPERSRTDAAMEAPPSYKKVNPTDSPILLLSARSDTMPLTEVDDYGNLFLAQQISQVPGVALVTISATRRLRSAIQVDPAKLSSSGVTLEDIRGTLVNATANGTLNTDKISFTIAAILRQHRGSCGQPGAVTENRSAQRACPADARRQENVIVPELTLLCRLHS
jgi:multidrug efflux pump subunit AcrB